MIKSSIYYEDMTITNIYAPNNRVTKYMKQKLSELKEERVNDSWRLFNLPLSKMDRTTGHKINKEIEDLDQHCT